MHEGGIHGCRIAKDVILPACVGGKGESGFAVVGEFVTWECMRPKVSGTLLLIFMPEVSSTYRRNQVRDHLHSIWHLSQHVYSQITKGDRMASPIC